MKTLQIIVAGLAAVLVAARDPVFAANCGDRTGPGGTDVPCNCGDTVTTDTRLTNDPAISTSPGDVCPSNGLIVNPGITLSLGTQFLRGSGSGAGVNLGGDATLQGPGSVEGFVVGVAPSAGAGQRILSIQARRNRTFGILCLSSCLIRENFVTENGTAGFQSAGILLQDDNNTVISNRADSNPGDGINVGGFGFVSNGNIVMRNTANGNRNFGVGVEGSGNLIEANESTRNGGGILVSLHSNTLTSNKTESNRETGILVGGNSNVLKLNSAKLNASGIIVSGTFNALEENLAYQNTGDGLLATNTGGNPDRDKGKNAGVGNGGIQCQIDGTACAR